jgi:hypothetical protein
LAKRFLGRGLVGSARNAEDLIGIAGHRPAHDS